MMLPRLINVVGFDTSRPNAARVYDHCLGGKDNFAADREVAEKMIAVLPGIPVMARANRRFLLRAVRHVVARLGIRQFLDVGSGLPTMGSVHAEAQVVEPTARVVYVDNDPLVAAHSRALLSSRTPAGRVEFVTADARDPGSIVNHDVVISTLDLTEPVALLLVSMLMYFPDAVTHHIVSSLLAGLPPGSCLVLSHPTADLDPTVMEEVVTVARREGGLTCIPRSHAQITRFFTGLDPVAPGVVPLLAWNPTVRSTTSAGTTPDTSVYYHVGVGIRRHHT